MSAVGTTLPFGPSRASDRGGSNLVVESNVFQFDLEIL
jgi:hypothetical protein